MSNKILVVHKKVEEILYRIYPTLKNFPKAEKFALCQQIKDSLTYALRSLLLAHSVRSKKITHLQQAQAYLYDFSVLLKLSRQEKYISISFYEIIDLNLSIILNDVLELFKAE